MALGLNRGTKITGDEVAYHPKGSGPMLSIEEGATFEEAYVTLERLHIASETVEALEDQIFPNRPNDVAAAVAHVIQEMFGVAFGLATRTMFGENPPTFRSVPISLNESIEVATGPIGLPTLEKAVINVGQIKDKELGVVGCISTTMKRKDRPIVKEFLLRVAGRLRTHSIYQGKALKIVKDLVEPQFMDVSTFPTLKEIVYSDVAMAALQGSVLYRLRYRDQLAAEGVTFKSSTLLYGPYGTGKSSFGQVSALEALQNGVTVVFSDAGADVEDLLRTSRLYGPSLAFVEDIDTYASSGDADQVTRFLDAFDGITAKSGNVMVIMTTNEIKDIHKGFLRPGRVDACVEITYLDLPGTERLMRALIDPKKLADNVDFEALYAVSEFYTPSFLAQIVKIAKIHAIGKAGGKHNNYVLDTKALVDAAYQLKGHHELMEAAGKGQQSDTLAKALQRNTSQAVEDTLGLVEDADKVTLLKRDGKTLGQLESQES